MEGAGFDAGKAFKIYCHSMTSSRAVDESTPVFTENLWREHGRRVQPLGLREKTMCLAASKPPLILGSIIVLSGI